MQNQPLAEHQQSEGLQASTNDSAYNPSSEERAAVQMVRKLFAKAKKARGKFDEKWLDNYRMFRGKQWKEERPSYRHSAVLNKIFQTIQSQVPFLTDSRPKLEFLPTEPQDRELAEILTDVAASDWEKHNWLMELVANIYDAHIYGTGIGYVGFDQDKDFGAGAICFEAASPFYSFPDPEGDDVNDDDAKFFIYAEPMDVERLKSEYPDKADFIKSDLSNFMDSKAQGSLNKASYKSPVNNKTMLEGSDEIEDYAQYKALKITAWIKDEDVIEETMQRTDPASGEVKEESISRLKYPNGRKVVIQGNVLLEDGPNPYDDGKAPYARVLNYMSQRDFWGISEIEQLEGPQVIYNKVFSFVLDVLTLMGNPIWVVDQNAGVDTDNMYNKPGMVVEPLPNTRVERVEGVQLQPYVLQLLEVVGREIQDISGSTEVSRGIKPEGVTAASAISKLQETAQTRVRQKSRFVDAYLQDVGQLYLSRVFQFYTAPRIFRITNNQNAQKYFKFHVENQPEVDQQTGQPTGGTVKVARVRPYLQDQTGQYLPGDEKQYQVSANFDVRVSTGSSLPFAKDETASLAFQLFDRRLLDPETMLKTIDFPNYEAVIEKLKANQAMQAQAQLAPQAQGPALQGR